MDIITGLCSRIVNAVTGSLTLLYLAVTTRQTARDAGVRSANMVEDFRAERGTLSATRATEPPDHR